MTGTTTIPCKRPTIELLPAVTNPGCFVAVCHVPGCGWTYPENPRLHVAVKTDAQQQATRHRGQHRATVPQTSIEPRPNGSGFYGWCSCMWDTPASVTTRTDVEASIASHLASQHGLVTC